MKRLIGLVALLAVTFVLYAIDLWGLRLSPLLGSMPWLLLLVAAIDTAVIALGMWATRDGGWSLAGRLALLIFGVKTAVIVVETVYLPDVLPLAWAPGLLVNGAVTALLLATAATWLLGRGVTPAARAGWFPWRALSWRRWLTTGVLWAVLFVAAGLLIFQPLARALDRAAADAYLAAFTPDNPMLILGFQVVRGLLWTLCAWPLLNVVRGGLWRRGVVLGLLFAGLMGSAQLQGIAYLPDGIWPAHLVEVMFENFLFGFVVAWGMQVKERASYKLQVT